MGGYTREASSEKAPSGGAQGEQARPSAAQQYKDSAVGFLKGLVGYDTQREAVRPGAEGAGPPKPQAEAGQAQAQQQAPPTEEAAQAPEKGAWGQLIDELEAGMPDGARVMGLVQRLNASNKRKFAEEVSWLKYMKDNMEEGQFQGVLMALHPYWQKHYYDILGMDVFKSECADELADGMFAHDRDGKSWQARMAQWSAAVTQAMEKFSARDTAADEGSKSSPIISALEEPWFFDAKLSDGQTRTCIYTPTLCRSSLELVKYDSGAFYDEATYAIDLTVRIDAAVHRTDVSMTREITNGTTEVKVKKVPVVGPIVPEQDYDWFAR